MELLYDPGTLMGFLEYTKRRFERDPDRAEQIAYLKEIPDAVDSVVLR